MRLCSKLFTAVAACAAPFWLGTGTAFAQVQTEAPPAVPGAKPVTVERIRVHGAALEGNLEGNPADRDVIVYLPPSYHSSQTRRYPVVYALHGYSVGAAQWSQEMHMPRSIEGAFGLGTPEMIVVVPDSKTMHNGSMYSSSVTVGDFERFVSHDLVAYVDAHYRTIPQRRSRGLVGHSMGGYGATRIGMKHPDVFGSLYIMSPCCLATRTLGQPNPQNDSALAALTSPAESSRLPGGMRILVASAAAWSPNPQNPPLYIDWPFENGAVRNDVLVRWAANAPLNFVDQYVGNLRMYHGIAMDVGDRDGLRTGAAALHEAMNAYGLANTFDIYSGSHTSAMGVRFQTHVLPFFGRNLCRTGECI